MWSRLIRSLTAILNAYSFYRNPVKFVLSILVMILVPYLAYIFLGGVIFTLLVGFIGYTIYRSMKKPQSKTY